VCILREAVHHGEDDGLATNLGQRLDEVHADILPDRRWHRQRLQEASRVEVFDLVSLADDAGTNEVLDGSMRVRHVEVAAQSMEGALDAFMIVVVSRGEDRGQQGERGGHEETVVEGYHPVHQAPRFSQLAGHQSCAKLAQGLVSCCHRAERREEVSSCSPNGMTRNSYRSSCVLKAVLAMSAGFMRTW